MASWTAVRVRERGRFCFWVLRERVERLGRGRMRREARTRTWRSENFFSSSRVRLRTGPETSVPRKPGQFHSRGEEGSLPLLDTVETLQERDGDKDDNSLLAVTNLDLFKITKLACELPVELPVSRTEPRGPLPVLFHVRPECFSVCMFAARCCVGHLSKSGAIRCRQTNGVALGGTGRWSVARFMFSEPKLLSFQEDFQV